MTPGPQNTQMDLDHAIDHVATQLTHLDEHDQLTACIIAALPNSTSMPVRWTVLK